MGKIYLLLYIILIVYAKYIDGIAQILAVSFGLFFGFLFANIAGRNIRLKKQGLKIPSFYDDFKKDFNTLTIAFKKTINALKISSIWTSKTIFKGLKWLFSYEGLKSIGSLIFTLLYAVFVLVSYLAAVIFAISAIIGLIAGIIDFFKLFKKD